MEIKSEPMDETHLSGELNISNCERRVWLAKIPAFLYDEFVSNPGKAVGSVKLKANDMRISLTQREQGTPGDYKLLYDFPPYPTFAFSEDEEGQLALEGLVYYKCDLKPEDSNEYRGVVRSRVEKSNVKTRQLKTIDNISTTVAKGPVHRDTNFFKKADADLKVKMDRNELIKLLFRLFEQSTYFDLKNLTVHTKQSAVYLKEILNELCIFNKRGPHKGMFELKPQFKKSNAETKDAEPKLL